MKSIAVICVLFGVAFAIPDNTRGENLAETLKEIADKFDSLDDAGRIQVTTDFVDKALDEARLLMIENGYDPMKLPDYYKRISFRPIIITYWGDFNLSRGWLQDASTIQRNGDIKLDYADRILTVDVPIKFEDFVFDYAYKIRIMSLGPKGNVDGYTENIRLSFKLGIDFNKLHLELENFRVEKIGKIHVEFSGNIFTDWLINIASNVTLTFFKGIVEWICQIVVKDALQNLVDTVNGILAEPPPDVTTVEPSLMYRYIIK